MRLTRAQNVLRLAGNVQNRVVFWGSAPGPAEGAYDAPSDSLVGRGFLPSAITASRLWRLQFPGLGRALVGGDCFHHSRGDRRHCLKALFSFLLFVLYTTDLPLWYSPTVWGIVSPVCTQFSGPSSSRFLCG